MSILGTIGKRPTDDVTDVSLVKSSPIHDVIIFSINYGYSTATTKLGAFRITIPCDDSAIALAVKEALDDPRIFQRVMQIAGALWCSPMYRSHMKVPIKRFINFTPVPGIPCDHHDLIAGGENNFGTSGLHLWWNPI